MCSARARAYASGGVEESRPAPRTGGDPLEVLGRLNNLGPGGASLLGVLKQPWAITAAAAIFVVHHHMQGVVTIVAFACFTVASTASVGLMFFYYEGVPARPRIPGATRDQAMPPGPECSSSQRRWSARSMVLDGVIGLTGS